MGEKKIKIDIFFFSSAEIQLKKKKKKKQKSFLGSNLINQAKKLDRTVAP